MASAIDDFLNYGKPKPPKAGEPSAIDSFLAYKPAVAAPAVEPPPPPVEPEGPGFLKSAGAVASAFGDYAVGGFADAVAGGARALGEDPSLLLQAANPLVGIARQTGLVDRPAADPNMLQFADEFANDGRARDAAATLQQAGVPEDSIAASLARGGGSIGNMAASIGAGLITRSPAVGAAVAGAGSYGSAYNEDIGPDATVEEKQRRATIQAGIEGAAERLGLKYILPQGAGNVVAGLVGRNALTRVGAAGGVGALEEAGTTVAQMGADELQGYQDFSGTDYARALQDSAVAGGAFSAAARVGTLGADARPDIVLPPTGDPEVDAGVQDAAAMGAAANAAVAGAKYKQAGSLQIPENEAAQSETLALLQKQRDAAIPPTPVVAAPFVDDSQTLAHEADLTSIDQQVATERAKTLNNEARNRVITELASGKDKRTAAAVQKMIGEGRVQFYGDQATLPEGANSATDKGYFDGTKIYLNEAKLGKGEANSVILHEVKHFMDVAATKGGAKISRKSMRSILGDEGNVRANKRIQELADKGNKIAKEAIEDATYGATQADGNVDQAVLQDEVSAYFLQKAEIAKSQKKPLGMAVGVVRDILSAAKTRLIDFGIDLNLSENDILYLGKQLVGEAARTQIGQGNTQKGQVPAGRKMLVGKKAQNYKKYLDEGIVFAGALDRLPRAEVDDSKTTILPEGKESLKSRGSAPLGAVFDHPELYNNYPDLKRAQVRMLTPEEVKASPDLDGFADADSNTIVLSPRLLADDKELRRLLVHEGQHIVQTKEGFAPGASVNEYLDPEDSQALTAAKSNLTSFTNTVDRGTLNTITDRAFPQGAERPVAAQNILNAALNADPSLKSFSRQEQAMLREYTTLLKAYTPLEEKRRDALKKYVNTAGEVEARTAEARIEMTQGERRETPFKETSRRMDYGVKDEDLVDNTKPESGSRFADQRAQARQKALSERPVGRASKERPKNAQVDTPAFNRWFKDSPVMDANGDPLVMYHGTSGNEKGEAFNWFDTSASKYGLMGVGAYFTDNPSVASEYTSKGRGDTPTVYPVYLSIQNPIDMDAKASPRNWKSAFKWTSDEHGTDIEDFHDGGDTNESWYRAAEDLLMDASLPNYEGAEIMRGSLEEMGYDGITHVGGGRVDKEGVRHRVYVAFSPEQIKSATGNSGEFSPTSPNMLASKARPEQPERIKKRLKDEGIEQPLSRRAPMPTQARGVVPASDKFVGEKTRTPATEGIVSKIKAAGDVALAAVAPSSYGKAADVSEVLERATGETTESKVRSAQAINALESTVKQVPKAKRDGVRRALVDASSENAKVRAAGIETLKTAYPAVYAQYDSVRNQIRQWGLDAVVSIRDSGKQLTKKDVAVVSKMLKNLDTYVTRAYRKDFKGPIADQQVRDTQGAWEKETKKGALVSEGAKTFEEARQFLVDTLRIGQREGMLKAAGNLKDFKPQTLEQLEALHAEWVSRENFNTLPVDATVEQQETYINTMLLDLENVRKSMSDADYLKKLDDKALRLTKELLDTVNTGSSKLVQFFRGARQDNTIVSAREDVPVAIRKLWGEITEPTAALAITLMRQGEFLARQKMLRELYDTGLGRYFVDQKDATSDTFTEKLVGETFGPLEGMYATPRFKQQVESNIEPLNSWRKVMEAMTSGKADVATQAAAGMSIKFLSSLGSKNKKATVVWNPISWLNNFAGGPATPVMQGMIPGKNIRKAASAAIGLVGPSHKKEMTEYTSRVLKANLQESGQVGEIQQAQKDIIQSLLLDQSALGRLNAVRKRVDDKLVDAYAMTDVVWKLDAFFSTVDWLKEYYKAKGITRTDEQIDREAAARVKDRSITFSRAAPLVKFTEKLGVTSYAPYFYETYRTIGMSLIGAGKDIIDGKQEGGEAGRMKMVLGARSAAGATAALFYNRAILPAYEAVGGAALLGMVALGAMPEFEEEDEEKLAVIRKGMGDFYNGKELTFWRKTDDGKFIFIEPGRVNPNDPATGPAAMLMSGDPEAALEAIGGLFFGNQGIAAVLGVGGEMLFDGKAKKPSSAYSTAQKYSEMENTLQNSLGIDPDTTAQVTRVIEKYAPKVLKTSLREATEDTGLEGADKLLAAMGQPFAVFDPKKDLKLTGFRDYSAPIDKAKEDFKTAIQTTNPSDEVIQEAYLRSLRMEHEAFTRMREVVEAAKMTGLRPDQVAGILKGSNIGNGAQVASLLSGKFKPSFVSETSVQNSRKQELKEDGAKVPEINSKYRRIDRIISESNKAFLEEIN